MDMTDEQSLFFDNEDDFPSSVPNRRLVRIRIMQALYAYEIGHEVGGSSIEFLASHIVYPEFKSNTELLEFAQTLIRRAFNSREECDFIIKSLAENWEFHRITPIDKVLLRIGLTELLQFPEIPTKVTINEAIEIAKLYSTDKSGIFINGVLDAALSKLKEEGRLKKSGRGLVGGKST